MTDGKIPVVGALPGTTRQGVGTEGSTALQKTAERPTTRAGPTRRFRHQFRCFLSGGGSGQAIFRNAPLRVACCSEPFISDTHKWNTAMEKLGSAWRRSCFPHVSRRCGFHAGWLSDTGGSERGHIPLSSCVSSCLWHFFSACSVPKIFGVSFRGCPTWRSPGRGEGRRDPDPTWLLYRQDTGRTPTKLMQVQTTRRARTPACLSVFCFEVFLGESGSVMCKWRLLTTSVLFVTRSCVCVFVGKSFQETLLFVIRANEEVQVQVHGGTRLADTGLVVSGSG